MGPLQPCDGTQYIAAFVVAERDELPAAAAVSPKIKHENIEPLRYEARQQRQRRYFAQAGTVANNHRRLREAFLSRCVDGGNPPAHATVGRRRGFF